MQSIEGIVFDAYGTLLHLSRRLVHKEIPRLLGITRQDWMPLLRDHLLTRAFSDSLHMADFIRRSAAPDCPSAATSLCAEVIDRETRSVKLDEDALPVLKFLKRKGLRLGLASNLASPYKEPLTRLGLDEHFDVLFLSCDEGVKKPESDFYLRLCDAMSLPPQRILFVGDSLRNDVLVPRAMGMQAIRIGGAGTDDASCARVADLAWLSLADDQTPERLLAPGRHIELAGQGVIVQSVEPVPKASQGRYNLVYAGYRKYGDLSEPELFFKRFLLPESAHVEDFAHRLCASVGLPACKATVLGTDEPFLALSRAAGSRMQAPVSAETYYDVGRHTVFAYLFSNADMRPRNAFVSSTEGRAEVTMIDFEYCFLNLALDMSGVEDRFSPGSVDRLSAADIARRLKRRVLTPKTMWRALRQYLGLAEDQRAAVERYRRGFLDCFESVRAQESSILSLIEERVYRDPYLIVGTSSYRRAMARVDIDDIRGRLTSPPAEVLESFCPS